MSIEWFSWLCICIQSGFYIVVAFSMIYVMLKLRRIYNAVWDIQENQLEDSGHTCGKLENINEEIEIIRQEMHANFNSTMDYLRELEVQIAIIKGTMGSHIPIQMPYQGAKRGPKPKQIIEQDE